MEQLWLTPKYNGAHPAGGGSFSVNELQDNSTTLGGNNSPGPFNMSEAKALHVLYLEDNPNDCELVAHALKADGLNCEFTLVVTGADFKSALEARAFDLIFSDFSIPGFCGTSALRLARETTPETPFVFVSGTIGEERAVEGMRSGATDYVLKNHLSRLGSVVRRAMRESQDRRERQKVKEQLQLFRSLIDRTNDAIEIIDPETGLILDVNEQACRAHGYTREEYLSLTLPELVPSLAARPWDEIRETLRASGSRLVESEHRRKDGSVFPVEVRVTYIQHDQEAYILAIARDITERNKAEAALQDSEERFRQIAENIEEVFWLTDLAKGAMLYVSPAYEKIWGRTRQSLYDDPRSWLVAIHPEDRDRVSEAARSRQAAGNYNEDYRIVRPDGELRWINDRAFPILDSSGNAYRIAGVASDITEKKKLEAQFLRAQRMESIGTLAGGIAHDLNNALAPVLMAGEMLRQKLPDADSQAMLEMILNGARRGAEMVRQVLTFSRGLSGKHVAVNAKHLIREIEGIMRQTFPKNIRIRTECAGDLWLALGDATQLHQVLLNLTVNARDAMPHGGNLTIKATNFMIDEHFASMSMDAKAGPHILLSVGDTGTGMPPEVRERIFDPFFTTKPLDKGTGLGLSTVRGIVKSHGGFISVYSEVGRGSEFRVFLPAQCRPSSEAVSTEHRELPLGKGELVLVVDDEEAIRVLTQRTLEAFNYKVLTASNGAEAMAVCAREGQKIELMITDIAMPIMDGTTLIMAARSLIPDLKIILASGLGDAPQKEANGKSSGFIHKPFTAEDLLKTIHASIDSTTSP